MKGDEVETRVRLGWIKVSRCEVREYMFVSQLSLQTKSKSDPNFELCISQSTPQGYLKVPFSVLVTRTVHIRRKSGVDMKLKNTYSVGGTYEGTNMHSMSCKDQKEYVGYQGY